jgi:hypothetical protein
VWSLTFSPDGTKLLSTCGYNCSGYRQHVWDVDSGVEVVTYAGHDSTVLASAISADGKLAATGGGEQFPIQVWSLANGQREMGQNGQPVQLAGTGAQVWAVGFSKDSKRLAWGTLWRRASGGTGHASETGSPLMFQLRLPSVGQSLGAPEAVTNEDDFVRAIPTYRNMTLTHRPGGTYGYDDAILDVKRNGKTVVSLERDAYDGYGHWAYSFTPDGKSIISGGANGQLYSFDVASVEAAGQGGTLKGSPLWKFERSYIGHEGVVWAVTPSPDGRYLVSGNGDQTLRLWNLQTQELIVTVFRGTDGEWAMWTPQGYYAASTKGEALVGWNLNRGPDKEGQWITAEQMRGLFYKPEVVARAIADASATQALKEAGLTLTATEALKSRTLPLIRDVMWPPAGTVVTGGKGIITVAVQKSSSPPTSWNFKVGVLDSNQEDRTVSARPVTTPAGHPAVADDEDLFAFEIPLHKGQNIVKLYASNANGDSQKWEYPIFHDGDGDLDQHGTLHVLAIGVDRYPGAAPLENLNFAGRDAKAFAEVAARTMKGRNKDVDVQVLCQIDGCTAEPTYANILAALKRLSTSPDSDSVVVFMAGHGESSGEKYYFLPTDFQRSGRDVRNGLNALDWTEVEKVLGSARGSKLLFVDACRSGTAYFARLQNDAQHQGVIAFSSAGPNQLAYEDGSPDIRHGLFTYYLIKGLTGGAESDPGKHMVSALDLGYFVGKQVPAHAARLHLQAQIPPPPTVEGDPVIAWP